MFVTPQTEPVVAEQQVQETNMPAESVSVVAEEANEQRGSDDSVLGRDDKFSVDGEVVWAVVLR